MYFNLCFISLIYLLTGERFQSQTHAFFSTLSIIDVSQSDNKNITCMAEGHNLTINVAGMLNSFMYHHKGDLS